MIFETVKFFKQLHHATKNGENSNFLRKQTKFYQTVIVNL